jgi:hypothetical protein
MGLTRSAVDRQLAAARAGRDDRLKDGSSKVSLETRNGKGEYYVRAFRRGGRIVREYVGSGWLAECAAAVDELERARRAQRSAARSMEVEQLDLLEKMIADYGKTAEVAAHEVLTAAGYMCHQRGEWRKTRASA